VSKVVAGCAVAALAVSLSGALSACSGGSTSAAGAAQDTSSATGSASATAPSGGSSASGSSGAGSPAGGSSAGTPSAAASGAAVPAGDQRIGGAAQGISIAVPASWVAINLAEETLKQAAAKLHLGNLNANQVLQGTAALQKDHAVIVYDLSGLTDSPTAFATNLNAYCAASEFTNTASSAVAILRQSVPEEFQSIGATGIVLRNVSVGGVPGLEVTYEIGSAVGPLYEGQLEVAPKPDRLCAVTLSGAKGSFPLNVLTVAAATAQFPS
jgi:hypothetical protein